MNLPEREMLDELVKLGNQFRNTPIVDDDFPAKRNAFDECLDRATAFLKAHKPPTISTTRMVVDGCMGYEDVSVDIFRR